ncbi:MAG: NAAT family transporter [Candidatus Thermoplasmatota archaeon]|nr:NAAT family transporter [Candidatus Thermoplasmatota archaeon]
MDYGYLLAAFAALFAIVNPVGNISIFTTLTQGFSRQEKRHVASKAVVTSALALILFGLIGRYVFMLFSITIPAFRIAGGLLLFRVAFSMLYGTTPGTKTTRAEEKESLEKEMVGVIPLGIPMLAGPGAISTVMLYISRGDATEGAVVFGSVLVIMLITYLLFLNADVIFSRLGRVGSMAVSRIMGLILATVAVQFLINGIHDVALEWAAEMGGML